MNIIIVLLTHARWYKSTDRCVPDPLFSTRGVATPDYVSSWGKSHSGVVRTARGL